MSLAEKGVTDIYTMDLNNQEVKRLTKSPSIDTSPSFSPDGKKIIFNSDRGGTQQLYIMDSNGRNVKRISFGKGRYATPVWAPKGELNHSNNITYSDSSNTIFEATSSNKVYSEKLNGIKNVVSSSFISASFSKTTYISKIRVYDKHERLIGVATLPQPIRKRERDEFIFKIQLDI